jgi:transposase InsO family protein
MGLKGAPSYFQRVMATVVLAGLLWIHGVSLYVDDLLVYGRTFEEYMTRLRRVLERLEEYNITVNPTKCEFGMSEVEYTGYVLNERGYTLSDERKEAVFNIPQPMVGKQMKSFLGVANYFRDFIPDFSRKIEPLQAMIGNYDRTRRLVWSQDAQESWDSIREAIRQCQTLHFVDPDAPVYLHTDASDYGIGGYLFQIVDGKEVPIAFMSKSLSDAECRWSVTEKECYAFVYMFKKYEYLLRDRYFILRTDHRNLTYLNESASPKVRRWKMLIAEFDFSIEYIKGEDNIVADAQSRLLTDARLVGDGINQVFAMSEETGEVRWCHTRDQRETALGTKWGRRTPPDNARPCEMQTHAWEVTELLATLVEIESTTLREQLNAKWEEVKIPDAQYTIIGKHHNSRVGHHGVERTLAKLRAPPSENNNYRATPTPWPQMREHIIRFIKTCPCCQKMNRLRTPVKTRGFTTASAAPMDRISIDTITGLPTDEDGNTSIIVIIDSFTRWVELYACPSEDAAHAVKALIAYIKTYGQPSQLLSDNGTQYANQVVAELCRILGTEHIRTVAYSHEDNAICEVNVSTRRSCVTLRHSSSTTRRLVNGLNDWYLSNVS